MSALGPDSVWKLAVDLGQFALTGIVGIYVYWSSQAQARREALERLANRLDQRLDSQDGRLLVAESQLGHTSNREQCAVHLGQMQALRQQVEALPSHDDIKHAHGRIDRLGEAVSRIEGQLQGIDRSLAGIDRQLQLIIEQLLDHPPGGHRP